MIFFRKKIFVCCIFLILSSNVFGNADSFLKKDNYQKRVYIENPETSPAAEAFLRNNISITTIMNDSFSFKTVDESGKYIVYIYYQNDIDSREFVGKYVYTKKDPKEDTKEFIIDFVNWMLETAWEKK